MDGFKAKLSNSLQFQLSAWLSAVVVLLALAAGSFSFWASFEEANELQDDQLRQVASKFDLYDLPIRPPRAAGPQDSALEPDLQIAVHVLGESGTRREVAPAKLLILPLDVPDGLQTLSVDNEPWRVLVRRLRSGQRLALGQQTAARDEIARHGALRTILPLLVLVPLVIVLVAVVVRRGLRPVSRLALELDRRAEQDLAPLPTLRVPNEIVPFTAAINRLLARVSASMEAQRRFVADAAHELRSPLTALSLQAEGLAGAELAPHARGQLDRLRQGVQRARTLLDTLLELARFQLQAKPAEEAVSASAVLRRVLEDLVPYAESRQIDLGVEQHDEASVRIREVELYAIMRNLVDNAVRYSPAGGRVDISLRREADVVSFDVVDEGAGIPPHERERVFDAFYRILGTDTVGSGLGLSIVKTLVDRAGGRISLNDAGRDSNSRGLRVIVKLPAIAANWSSRKLTRSIETSPPQREHGTNPGHLAEAVRFELTEELPLRQFSRLQP